MDVFRISILGNYDCPLLAGSRTFGYAVVVVDAVADPVPTLLRTLLANLSMLNAYETL